MAFSFLQQRTSQSKLCSTDTPSGCFTSTKLERLLHFGSDAMGEFLDLLGLFEGID